MASLFQGFFDTKENNEIWKNTLLIPGNRFYILIENLNTLFHFKRRYINIFNFLLL